MIRDVFYYGKKPNAHPRETHAKNLDDARSKATTEHFWIINEYCVYNDFDWEWDFDDLPEEDIWAQDHNNVWPSIYQKDSGTWLCSKNQSDVTIYRNDVLPLKRKNEKNEHWVVLADVDENKVDWGWHPDPTDPPFVHCFSCEYYPAEIKPVLQYVVPGATQNKYVHNIKIPLLPDKTNWIILENIDEDKVDWAWRPSPVDPPFIYCFGCKYYDAEVKTVLQYAMPGATQNKYVHDIKIPLLPDKTNWIVSGSNINSFDFAWQPNPTSPPYIYQFGTSLDKNDGPQYITKGNDGTVVYIERNDIIIKANRYIIETTLDELVKQHPDEIFWALRKNIDYTNFNFDWRPQLIELEWESDYVHVFGSPESELTQTYFVNAPKYLNGFTSLKFTENTLPLDDKYLAEVFEKPDIFYVDRGNKESIERYKELQARFGSRIQKTRYMNSWTDTITRLVNKAKTQLFWVLNSELDYSQFDFEYYPNPWQMTMIHIFGTQWSHWGNTYMINRDTFTEDTKHIKIIEHLSNHNFVKSKRAKATRCLYDIVMIDHDNREADVIFEQLQANDVTVTRVKYKTSYLQTIKEIIAQQPLKKEHYLWIASSVCDYSSFDFSYITDPYARDQVHVFASGIQKFGDTFFLDVNLARESLNDLTSLEDHKINFNPSLRATRLKEPEIIVGADTHVNEIKNLADFPYTTLITADNSEIENNKIEPMCLWSLDKKNIIIASTGGTKVIAPREARDYVKNELYDYPYIKYAERMAKSRPLDIVFLSNGEKCADENYEHLLSVTKNLENRIVRIDGVNGRVKAYHAAAEASKTPWLFTVFAKLRVDEKFDWSWQPDRLQRSKHYIFYAKNPVNNLVYGHQAMIGYNKKLTLHNQGVGLDFTLDDQHEVIPMLSGVATFNTDEYSTWRTAFRECIKLRAEETPIARERLNAWQTIGEGAFAEYSIKGAQDALAYYDEVDGDPAKLKLSYEWAWLQERFKTS